MADPFGVARDGKVFGPTSIEVTEYMAKFPDVTLEVAIGSVVMEYDKAKP